MDVGLLIRMSSLISGKDTFSSVLDRCVRLGLDQIEQPIQADAKPNIITRVRGTRSDDRATEEMKANYENAQRAMDEANAKDEDGPEEMFSTVGPTDLMEKYGDQIRKQHKKL